MRRLPLLCLVVFSAVACQQESPTELYTGDPTLARNTNTEVTSNWQFLDKHSDGSASTIRGDGRGGDGKTVLGGGDGITGAYQNGGCGTRTRLFVPDLVGSGSGDATIDPDVDYSNRDKCERRFFVFALSTGTMVSGAFTNARQLWSSALANVGDTRTSPMTWSVDLPNCERLSFDSVVQTRQMDADGKRVWSVESQAPHHTARCQVWSGGAYVFVGEGHMMPFRVQIMEVR